MGRLDVRVVEARNLPNTEMIGKPDPYVKVELDNHQHKTSVADSTLNPKWDEVFKFVVADPDSCQLELKLFDSNLVSDKFMGQYKMSISGLTKGVVKDVWCLLQQCKSNAEIHIRIMAHDFGHDATPDQAAAPVAPVPQVQQAPPVVQQQPMMQQQQAAAQQQAMMAQQQAAMQQQQMAQQQAAQQQQMAQQQAMMAQQQAMQQQQMGMMGAQPGYPGAQPGYPGAQPGYPGAQMGGQQPPQTFQDFQMVQFRGPVRRATYGPAGSNNDYTMQVNQMIQRGQMQVHGGIHTVLGDPSPGVPKVFQVWY